MKEPEKEEKEEQEQVHNEPKLRLNFPKMMKTEEHLAERSHNFKWKININYVIICFVLFPILAPLSPRACCNAKQEKNSLPQMNEIG